MKLPFEVLLLFILPSTLIAQKDSVCPLKLTISIEKQYVQTRPKGYFDRQYRRGDYKISTDTVKQTVFDVLITIKNVSTRPAYFWTMRCSWYENFLINNNYIDEDGWSCDGNYPICNKVLPGENKTFKTKFFKSIKFDYPCQGCVFGPQVPETKLGLIVIDDLYNPNMGAFMGYDLAMEDLSCHKMIWSNSLYLLSEKEANPDPIQIPVYQKNGQK